MNLSSSILLCLIVCLSLASCNTMQGVGKDIKAAGSAIEKGAQNAKGY